MKINLSKISQKDFNLSEREHPELGKLILITPTPKKHRWEKDELHLRSLLVRPIVQSVHEKHQGKPQYGEIVCSGFPKFRNYGEDQAEGVAFENHLQNNEVMFAEKMDGSLIIRSVINRKVNFRTRGCHVLADGFKEPVMALVREKYPNLLDPTMGAGRSHLFEYTAPTNRIVLKYDDSKLTALGMMVLHSSKLPVFVSNKAYLGYIEGVYKTPAVELLNLSSDLDTLCSDVSSWSNREGIVVWCGEEGSAMQIKLKAEEYLKIHRLKFHLSEDRVRKMLWFENIKALKELQDYFFNLGVDWEGISFVEEMFDSYIKDRNYISALYINFIHEITREGVLDLTNRKQQAKLIKRVAGKERKLVSVGFRFLDDKSIVDSMAAYVLKIPVNAIQKEKEKYKAEKE